MICDVIEYALLPTAEPPSSVQYSALSEYRQCQLTPASLGFYSARLAETVSEASVKEHGKHLHLNKTISPVSRYVNESFRPFSLPKAPFGMKALFDSDAPGLAEIEILLFKKGLLLAAHRDPCSAVSPTHANTQNNHFGDVKELAEACVRQGLLTQGELMEASQDCSVPPLIRFRCTGTTLSFSNDKA